MVFAKTIIFTSCTSNKIVIRSSHYSKYKKLATKMTNNTISSEKSQNGEVKDNYLIVYVLFVFIGLTHFLPGTFFITAHDYWMFKFRNVSSDEVDSDHRTTLQTDFSTSVTIATQLAVVLSSALSILFGYKLNVQLRLYGSLVVVLVLFVISAIFIHVDTDSWQTGFFVLTMFIVAGVHSMTTLLGVTFFSILSKFPSDYLGPYLNGQGVSGIFTSCLQLLSLGVGISTTKSALVYFWIAIALITACLFFLIVVARYNDFYRHYSSTDAHEIEKTKMRSLKEFLNIVKSIWKSLSLFFFYLWTVTPTHPAITSLIVSEGKGSGEWNDVYFVPVATFAIASTGDYIGRIITIKFKALANLNGVWYVAFSAARIVIFVPLIILCNIQPRSHLPVVFPHDYQYILIMVFFSLSNGFLMSIENLIIPKTVHPEKLEAAYHANYVGAAVLMAILSFLGFVSVEIL